MVVEGGKRSAMAAFSSVAAKLAGRTTICCKLLLFATDEVAGTISNH